MCTTTKTRKRMSRIKKKREPELSDSMSEEEYCQLQSDTTEETPEDGCRSRTREKAVYMATTVGVIILSHVLMWLHAAAPFMFTIVTPVIIGIKAILYWKNKWQYFILDFCYFANALTFVYMLLPGNAHLFRMTYALTNGPVLVAAAVWRNSLVYHQHDKVTSCYIHLMPAVTMFCVRWFPQEASTYWFRPFIPEMTPSFDVIWLYAAPFGFFLLHSLLYFTIVNVVKKPSEEHVSSYTYLADRFHRLNCINRTWGQCFMFYSLNWLFCLTTLLIGLLNYTCFYVNVVSLVVIFLIIVWNGGSFYMHVFGVRGFSNE